MFQLHLGDARPRRSRDSALDKGYVESAEDLCGWSSVLGIKRQKFKCNLERPERSGSQHRTNSQLKTDDKRLTTALLPPLLQLRQHLPRNLLQRFEHSAALEGNRFDHRFVFPPKLFGQGVHREYVGQVALIQL